MLTLSGRNQIVIAVLLAALMILTRSDHIPTLQAVLPSASWAVFFLAGVYLRPVWVPVGLFALASLLDFIAINWQGVSAYCVSPAYIALIPAYGAMWFAGRWFAGRYSFKVAAIPILVASVLLGTLVCELVSSGSFYFFSGRFAETSIAEFGARLAKYFPHSIASVAFWVGIAALAHAVALTARNNLARTRPS